MLDRVDTVVGRVEGPIHPAASAYVRRLLASGSAFGVGRAERVLSATHAALPAALGNVCRPTPRDC